MHMANTKPKPIKVLFDFTRKALDALIGQANAVYAGLKDNTAFPNPPVDLVSFRAQIDNLQPWNVYAQDGGKKAIAERNRLAEVVVKSMRQLAHYVEANCNDNMTTFLSSGFTAKSTVRKQTDPASQYIRSVGSGQNSGQIEVTP